MQTSCLRGKQRGFHQNYFFWTLAFWWLGAVYSSPSVMSDAIALNLSEAIFFFKGQLVERHLTFNLLSSRA